MDFMTVWELSSVGTILAVSNGDPEPAREEIYKWASWRQRNCVGTVVSKSPGQLVIRLPAGDEGQPVFVLREGNECDFDFPEPDLGLAEKKAVEKLEASAEAVTRQDTRRMLQQAAMLSIWDQVQRLKLTNATGQLAGLDVAERRRQFPALMALVDATGKTLSVVATEIETRYADRVRRFWVWQTKRLLAHDAVRSATTVEAKLAAADSVDWSI